MPASHGEPRCLNENIESIRLEVLKVLVVEFDLLNAMSLTDMFASVVRV